MRVVRIVPLAIAVCVVAFASACAGPGPGEPELEGTAWVMTSYRDASGETTPGLSGTRVDALFADGTLAGHGGCNRYTGEYRLGGDGLAIGELAATRTTCEPPVVEQEEAYFADLRATTAFLIGDGRLELLDQSGEVLVVFEPDADPGG